MSQARNIADVLDGDVTLTGDLTLDTNSLFIGGTGSANQLNDYEEGTWTPTNVENFGTLSSQVGVYVKIGQIVYIAGRFSFTGATTSYNRKIGGLPFTPVDEFSGTSVDHACLIWGDTRHFAFIDGSGNIILTSSGVIQGSLAASSQARFFATYRTSS